MLSFLFRTQLWLPLALTLGCVGTAIEREPVAVFVSSPVYPKEAVLLGGWQNGQWLNAANASLNIQKHSYRWQNLAGDSGEVKMTPPELLQRPRCERTIGAKISDKPSSNSYLYSNTPWPLQSRPVETLSTSQASQWVLDYLAAKPEAGENPKPPAKVRALSVDLDGDKVPEILLEASFFAASSAGGSGGKAPLVAQPQDYSLILLRSNEGDKTASTALLEFYGPKKQWQVGDKTEKPLAFAYQIAGLADINGDGALEIAIYEDYANGELFSLYSGRPSQGYQLALYEGCWE